MKTKRGFTLLELLLVIAIIASLAGIILMALNPAQRLEEANETKYLANARDLKKAIEAYAIENGGALPTGFSSLGYGYYDICKTTGSDCISVSELIPNYLPNIPEDIENSTSTKSGFRVKYDPDSTSINVYPGDEYEARLVSGTTFTEGLVGYWKMDESSWNGTAGEVIDSSGKGNSGTRGGNTTTVLGKYGNGGTFDGAGDYVDAGNNISLAPTSSFTYSVWVKTTDLDTNTIISWRYNSNFRIISGDLQYYYDGQTIPYANLSLNDGIWHHVVVAFNNNYQWKTYADGELINTSSNGQGSVDYCTGVDCNLKIGKTTTGSESWDFNGQIDEARIYNRALNADEVAALYLYGAPPFAYLKFDESSGTVANDSSGNNLNGTLVNGPIWTEGISGNAVSLDGVDDYIDITNSIFYDNTDITISMWLYSKPSSGNQSLLISGFDGNPWWHSAIDKTTGNMRTYFGTGYNTVSAGIQSNRWHHVAYTITNGTSNAGTLYIDSISKGNFNRQNGAGSEVYFGRNRTGYSYTGWYYGLVDQIKIYNYVLTPEQILLDMNNH